MSKEPEERELDQEELEQTDGEPLPDREVMSTVPLGLDMLPPIVPTGEELDADR